MHFWSALDYSTGFWVVVTVLDLYTLVRAVTRGHGVEGTLAWMFAILAFPGVGAGLYLLLANPNVRRATRRKQLSAAVVRRAIARVGRSHSADVPSAFSMVEGSILHLAASLTGLLPTGANQVKLLTENLLAFNEIESALNEARRSIWAECYIIRNDETGRRFLDLLARKASEGIEVRLLYDAFGSIGLDAVRLKAIQAAGGRAEVFLPMNPLRRRWAIHLRNHRKLIVVDGRLGFTGGANVGNEYSGRVRRRGAQVFRDSHLAVLGPAAGDLAQTFAEDWSFATGEQLTPPPPPSAVPGATSVVGILPSGPDQEHNANGMVYFTGIASARERCYLTSPYFIPDSPTLRSMESAALRGVDVRLLVPGQSDMPLVRAAARSYYPAILRAGIRVFEYQKAMLHAKTMVVDSSWGVVGSANVDIRSFRLNFELGALVFDPFFAEELEKRFLADLKESLEVTPESVVRRGFAARLRESTARLLSPLL